MRAVSSFRGAAFGAALLALAASPPAAAGPPDVPPPAVPPAAPGVVDAVGAGDPGERAEAAPAPAPGPARTVWVSSRLRWQNTGAQVRPGDRIRISYRTGRWTTDDEGRRFVGPEGYFPSIDRYRPQECKYERSVPYGRLIGRVDNATGFFSVGRSADRTATVSGPLWLRINDADRCLENNRGAVSVVIWITRGAPTKATP